MPDMYNSGTLNHVLTKIYMTGRFFETGAGGDRGCYVTTLPQWMLDRHLSEMRMPNLCSYSALSRRCRRIEANSVTVIGIEKDASE